MADDQATPDLTLGVPLADLADGSKILGHVGEHAVLLVRVGAEIFAVDAACTHYHAPLVDGLIVGNSLRCPWHHASFDLATGAASRPPALSPLKCWSVETRGALVIVTGRHKPAAPKPKIKAAASTAPDKIVIIGGGAAGFAAAQTLRGAHYQNSIVLVSSEAAAPVDRPNLSKDYLAGTAPEDWVPLRPIDFYRDHDIDLRLGVTATGIDPRKREVTLADGNQLAYDRLLLATGAEPVRPQFPGAGQPHVFTLRSLADCSAIIAQAKSARRAVVLGGSFIGLEVAAALRARDIEVHVVALDRRPLERVLGPQIGDFVRSLHESHGVIFHLEDTVAAVDGRQVTLKSGGALDADLVVVGIGVRPRLELAGAVALDRGVVVNAHLEASVKGIFAAGDIARWPDPHSGETIRVEHWVVALRQGQTAARNMLGHAEQFDAVPFFWSQHYDIPINYVGHAETWDELTIEGDIAAPDCLARYKRGGKTLAVASIYRDLDNLKAELSLERASQNG